MLSCVKSKDWKTTEGSFTESDGDCARQQGGVAHIRMRVWWNSCTGLSFVFCKKLQQS
jgi:hypothetical protein